MQWKYMSKHGEKPRDGVEIGNEANLVEVITQLWIMEGDHLGEHGQVLLYYMRVVLQEEVIQVFGNKSRHARICQGFIVEI